MSDCKPVQVYLGLGSNLGSRLDHLKAGLAALEAHPRLRPDLISGIWESEYVGAGNQDPYLNAAVRLETDLTPAVLLSICKGLEAEAGRLPDSHLQPRTLDLDVLLHAGTVQTDCEPLLPHPRLGERAFVLGPLAEIAGDLRLPDSGETVSAAYAKIRRKPGAWLRLRQDLSWALRGAAREVGERGSVAIHRR
ncbi:2-amino-4-hydroxy-6-hydroxymethyldihydropteridine diphosphokinase [bacterium]|nr:MAG: 2-amino-4-hydroxy-6-hydroxymethyldihydropteridine diphosphokinase [bacterium]